MKIVQRISCSVLELAAAAAHSLSDEVSKDSDRAKQQAQRNRVSSFHIALQSIKVYLPVTT